MGISNGYDCEGVCDWNGQRLQHQSEATLAPAVAPLTVQPCPHRSPPRSPHLPAPSSPLAILYRRQAGVSRRLYEEFLEPMLQVTLFLPGERLSAAAALGANV